ncbi:MAG: hypothetical protein HOC20_04460 [Chloroflexi bacterium]|jgi:hypothetical protein|nr:hypothetical protein [Chloroflexota bacterium]
MKKAIPVIILVLLTSFLLACSSDSDEDTPSAKESSSNPIGLVPQKANLLGYLNAAQLLDDEDIINMYNESDKEPGDPETIEDALDMIGAEGFGAVVLFADLSDMSDLDSIPDIPDDGSIPDLGELDGYMGIIVEGSFDKDKLIAGIEAETEEEITTSTHNNHTIYADSEGSAIAFLSDDMFVMGTIDPVKDVIDVKEGDESSVNGEVLDIYDDLGTALFKLAMLIPEGLAEEFAEEDMGADGIMSMDMSEFEDIETVALTVDKQDDSVAIEAQICFASQDSAQALKEIITDLAMLFGLEDLELSVNGSCVLIGIEITSAMIEDTMEGMLEGFAFELE